ncbi:MAG: cupredoxin domain-containing protein, partial [Candidatus Rokubacteria bacterium]|nr:cupredoxin domain-containing protein [Candidatus Rokubacteria bacterium]
MKRTERLALAVVLAIVIGLPAAVFSYQRLYGPAARTDAIFLRVRTVEGGGFDPARIVVKRGQRVKIRILAEDVTHGFQLLHFGVDAGAVKTGTTKVVEFTADRTGEFPFY